MKGLTLENETPVLLGTSIWIASLARIEQPFLNFVR